MLRHRTSLSLPFRFLILCGLTACSDGVTDPDRALQPVDLAQPWVTSSASAERFDASAFARVFERAATVENMRALVVVRNGRLVRAEYFNGATADSAFDLRSVTKTVTGLVVGLAVDRGLLSVDDPIARWLPDELLRPEHAPIRIRHMLTMTSGIQWSDPANFNPWVLSGRPIAYVLELPVVAEPGRQFIYNTGGSHLLSVMVGRAAGQSALDFAAQHLFGPLHFSGWRWPVLPGGDPVGGAALNLRPLDAARIGQLLLQKGRSGDQQIVSEEWIAEQTRTHIALGRTAVLPNGGYGYQVWTDASGAGTSVLWGYGGQLVFVVPRHNLVIVTIAHWRGVDDSDSHQSLAMVSLVNDLLAAVR